MRYFYSDTLHCNPVTPGLAAMITTGNVCAGVIAHNSCVDVVGGRNFEGARKEFGVKLMCFA